MMKLETREHEGNGRMTSPEAIGSVLQANRVKQGLSIQDVAERLETTRATVWRWETGKRKPSYEYVVKLREMGLLP